MQKKTIKQFENRSKKKVGKIGKKQKNFKKNTKRQKEFKKVHETIEIDRKNNNGTIIH